ncbi:MAG: hypothetical protein JXB62_12515, partial [Pirellulales bacterium]|nr:hypothetical protein [Pirellulales bacterium]
MCLSRSLAAVAAIALLAGAAGGVTIEMVPVGNPGNPNDDTGNGDRESGAYLNVSDQNTFMRRPGAKYFIPTENEWYKAAYHKNDGVTGNY